MKSLKCLIIAFMWSVLLQPAAAYTQETSIARLAVEPRLASLAWSPDGHRLAVVGEMGVSIYNASLQELAAVEWQTDGVLSISWRPDGQQFATGDANGTIRVWNYDQHEDTITPYTILPTWFSWIGVVQWSPDGTKLAALGQFTHRSMIGTSGWIQIWDTATWSVSVNAAERYGSPNRVVDWNRDSTRVLGGGERICGDERPNCLGKYGEVYILDATTGAIDPYLGLNASASDFMWANDDVMVAHEGIYRFDSSYSAILDHAFREYTPYIISVDPSGTLFAADFFDTLRIHDVATLQPVHVLQPATRIFKVDWSPQGDRIAAISLEGMIEIWDVSHVAETTPAPTITATPPESSSPTLTETPETLRDILTNPECDIACYMGIESGVTTRTELEAILNERDISYRVNTIGTQGMITSYLFDPNMPTPFIVGGENSIGVFLAVDTVELVDFNTTGVTVSDIINWYGAPASIGFDASNHLAYPDFGLVFTVDRADNDTIIRATLVTTYNATHTFMNIQPCQGPDSLCNLAVMSTPTPVP